MIEFELEQQLRSCKTASLALRATSQEKKNQVLAQAAMLLKKRSLELIRANQEDLAALPAEATSAFRDRLLINESRVLQMIESLEQVKALPDPVGEELDLKVLENGLKMKRVRSPLGVILMIFESRPNVAIEAFSLAFKAGNVIILRGGKESMRSTSVIYSILSEALVSAGLSKDCLWGITDPDRAITHKLLKSKKWIDIVVPRGGDKLIEYVVENSLIPIIKNDRGVCHVYVHEDADQEMALEIVDNAKTSRPGVCNSMETVLVHEKLSPSFIPALYAKLEPMKVRWHACPKTVALLSGKKNVQVATAQDWDSEYLDLIMNCRVVASLEEAIEHIDQHGSKHSEAIVTSTAPVARLFQSEVDAAAVYWNASTRFTDGFEMGLGGELGISTQKLHVRGPVGLRELTSVRWIIDGEGQVRK